MKCQFIQKVQCAQLHECLKNENSAITLYKQYTDLEWANICPQCLLLILLHVFNGNITKHDVHQFFWYAINERNTEAFIQPNYDLCTKTRTKTRVTQKFCKINENTWPHIHVMIINCCGLSDISITSITSGMVHSVSGWMRGVQVKLWDPWRTRAIPKRFRGVFMTRRYTNSRLPLPYLNFYWHIMITVWQVMQHVGHWIHDQKVVTGSTFSLSILYWRLWQAVHTNVSLSLRSIIWYCSEGGDIMRVSLLEFNGSLLLGLWVQNHLYLYDHQSCNKQQVQSCTVH